MSTNVSWILVFAGLCLLLSHCGPDDQTVEPGKQTAEPVNLVVDLVIEEAWTMDEVAKALTKETGIVFVLSPGIDPHKRLRDPYSVMSFKQNLKEHLMELEKFGIWSFKWKNGRYIVHKL